MDIFKELDRNNNLFNDSDYRRLNLSVPLVHLRDAQDPYNIDLNNFKKRYRFGQETVKNIILPLIYDDLKKHDDRGHPIAPELQILLCLRFYATASFQIVCGDLLTLSQPTASRIVARVSRLLAQQLKKIIKFPDNMEAQRAKFQEIGRHRRYPGLPSIDGAIDCTHVKIVSTPGIEDREPWRNRKGYFSINAEAVVGPRGHFNNIVARWAGSTHDSRIFQMGSLYAKYMEGQQSGYLVGDSGYPCLPFLMTPIGSPRNNAEEIYNKIQKKSRTVVERTFGMWKRRFPCLSRGLGNKLETVNHIIVACAVLFNISLDIGDTMPSQRFDDHEDADPIEQNPAHEGTLDGFAVRSAIVNTYA